MNRFSVVECSSFGSAAWSNISPSTFKSIKHFETSLSSSMRIDYTSLSAARPEINLLASSPQANSNFPLSFTLFTKSLSARMSTAGAARPDRCSATMKAQTDVNRPRPHVQELRPIALVALGEKQHREQCLLSTKHRCAIRIKCGQYDDTPAS